ncbi:MAG TPA: ion channel [Polyangiaceae bacterium]|nr:ion channel [Polyangiaceae bacterium]
MNERALLTLGLMLSAASGTSPEQWLSSVHERLRRAQAASPMNAALGTVLVGSLLFYAAERGTNPKVQTWYDALVYVSTNLSVGYSDILAKTPLGKALGSALMTYGPALAARVFDPPEASGTVRESASESSLREVADKLDAILSELRAQRAPSSAE